MGRPKRSRRIIQEPKSSGFRPESIENSEPINITIDEIEAIRIKDYKNIQQKKAAKIMDISQPTFHRTLYSARRKISKALVEGRIIKIKGGDFVTDKIRYKCKKCGFEWFSPQKEYTNCPDCKSEDIYKIPASEDDTPRPAGQPGMGRRRGYGGAGMGAGPPRVCKCTSCGYETDKTPGVPCRNSKCPKCGAQLCGAE